MASRTSQAIFSHKSKKWWKWKVGFPACTEISMMCLVPATDQVKSKLGMERMREEEMGAEEETCALNIHPGNEGPSSAPFCLSCISPQSSLLLQTSYLAGYKTVAMMNLSHHATTQPQLHIMGPEGEPGTSLKLLGKVLYSISLRKTMNHNFRNNMIISIYETNWIKKLSAD